MHEEHNDESRSCTCQCTRETELNGFDVWPASYNNNCPFLYSTPGPVLVMVDTRPGDVKMVLSCRVECSVVSILLKFQFLPLSYIAIQCIFIQESCPDALFTHAEYQRMVQP